MNELDGERPKRGISEVAGTLAVLLQASLRGYFDLPEAMKQLRQCGFRVSRPIEALMLARYEQANKTKP
jgi:predicted nucleic acid-binding protein